MKVLCIRRTVWVWEKSLFWGLIKYWKKDKIGPKYGETCTVEYEKDGFYALIEYQDALYSKEDFIPIQDEEAEIPSLILIENSI